MLDSAWFGAGYVLKEKAWAKANELLSLAGTRSINS
jgi:hypothetical protein